MSDETKKRLISIATTFGATFILGVATLIVNSASIEWTSAFWVSILVAGGREALKAVIATWVPVKLGGRKV